MHHAAVTHFYCACKGMKKFEWLPSWEKKRTCEKDYCFDEACPGNTPKDDFGNDDCGGTTRSTAATALSVSVSVSLLFFNLGELNLSAS